MREDFDSFVEWASLLVFYIYEAEIPGYTTHIHPLIEQCL